MMCLKKPAHPFHGSLADPSYPQVLISSDEYPRPSVVTMKIGCSNDSKGRIRSGAKVEWRTVRINTGALAPPRRVSLRPITYHNTCYLWRTPYNPWALPRDASSIIKPAGSMTYHRVDLFSHHGV